MQNDSCGDPAAQDHLVDFAVHAERYLSKWMRDKEASNEPLDIHAFKSAVTAMRQLKEARKNPKESPDSERSQDDAEQIDPEEFNRRVRRAIGKRAFAEEAEDGAGTLSE